MKRVNNDTENKEYMHTIELFSVYLILFGEILSSDEKITFGECSYDWNNLIQFEAIYIKIFTLCYCNSI